MVEWENRGENAAAASAAENQTLIPYSAAAAGAAASGNSRPVFVALAVFYFSIQIRRKDESQSLICSCAS